jgi:hypothetical protein
VGVAISNSQVTKGTNSTFSMTIIPNRRLGALIATRADFWLTSTKKHRKMAAVFAYAGSLAMFFLTPLGGNGPSPTVSNWAAVNLHTSTANTGLATRASDNLIVLVLTCDRLYTFLRTRLPNRASRYVRGFSSLSALRIIPSYPTGGCSGDHRCRAGTKASPAV